MGLYEEVKHVHSIMKDQLEHNPNSITDWEYSEMAERLQTILQKHEEQEAFKKAAVERPWDLFSDPSLPME